MQAWVSVPHNMKDSNWFFFQCFFLIPIMLEQILVMASFICNSGTVGLMPLGYCSVTNTDISITMEIPARFSKSYLPSRQKNLTLSLNFSCRRGTRPYWMARSNSGLEFPIFRELQIPRDSGSSDLTPSGFGKGFGIFQEQKNLHHFLLHIWLSFSLTHVVYWNDYQFLFCKAVLQKTKVNSSRVSQPWPSGGQKFPAIENALSDETEGNRRESNAVTFIIFNF